MIGLQSFLPNELIQYVEFLKAEDFFVMPFLGQDYEIIAKDDVGNFIGTVPNRQVFYLETAYDTHLDNMMLGSKAPEFKFVLANPLRKLHISVP